MTQSPPSPSESRSCAPCGQPKRLTRAYTLSKHDHTVQGLAEKNRLPRQNKKGNGNEPHAVAVSVPGLSVAAAAAVGGLSLTRAR